MTFRYERKGGDFAPYLAEIDSYLASPGSRRGEALVALAASLLPRSSIQQRRGDLTPRCKETRGNGTTATHDRE